MKQECLTPEGRHRKSFRILDGRCACALQFRLARHRTGIGIHAGHGHPRSTWSGAASAARGMAYGTADVRACGADHGSGRNARERL